MSHSSMSLEAQSLAPLLQSISGCRLMLVGDFMLDRTIYGEANRISPESPTPVISARQTRQSLGGAGNVVRNVASLGAEICCAAIVGDDEIGALLEQELRAVRSCQKLRVIREQGRKTTLKTRVVAVHPGQPEGRYQFSGQQQVLRVDEETCHPITSESAAQILEFAAGVMGHVQGTVISDYAKGALPPAFLQKLIEMARSAGKPVFVDPKGKDWSRYRGASVLTPNALEAEAAMGISFSRFESTTEARRDELVQRQVKDLCLDALLVTRGAEGVSLVDCHGFQHFPTSAREVFDVTGAGDTLLAAFSLAACSGANYALAAQFGNLAAGVAVGKAGAAAVHPFEVERELGLRHFSADAKVRTLEELTLITESLRQEQKKVVFTNGCFDLLHVGHMHLLREAKKLGDVLIVAINSDASVKQLKGEGRPIVPAEDRAYAIATLGCVDYVVIFEESDPMNLLHGIRPEVLVKGDQYLESQVVGAEFVKSYGGIIGRVPIRHGISTSALVEKIRTARA